MQSTKKKIVIKSDINLIHINKYIYTKKKENSLLKKLHLNIHRIYYFYIQSFPLSLNKKVYKRRDEKNSLHFHFS